MDPFCNLGWRPGPRPVVDIRQGRRLYLNAKANRFQVVDILIGQLVAGHETTQCVSQPVRFLCGPFKDFSER